MIQICEDWSSRLSEEFNKEYYLKLREFLKNEYKTRPIYPPAEEIYSALRLTSFENTKVVILGQDPYINKGEAHGLAFSVNKDIKIPPSLKNIYKEIEQDIGCKKPDHGCLTDWAKQGVLLLNTTLTVRAGLSRSHYGQGWEVFTDKVIELLNEKTTPIVFMLWGKNAQNKGHLITNDKHLVLTAAHPSPLAGGRFNGCKHFSKANAFLAENGIQPIEWQIY